ncbi:hypothetical protein N7516_007683 [Penicillium verrucosum]|uniref:uncharacterized protein n=1 Tax=Penicillium verrucosum TaxID=60171 RepID=UPI0025455C5F|nr:uncharacterized protein N7516_007683 [Penicillium verrucosum]KAJ5933194.1 hypothetical protein N7516_007683 [Penicillium verrucosum]
MINIRACGRALAESAQLQRHVLGGGGDRNAPNALRSRRQEAAAGDPTVIPQYPSENLTSTPAGARDSVMSNYSDSPDVECFEALPADTFEAIGSASRGLNCAVMHAVRDIGLPQSIYPVGSKTIQGMFSLKETDESFSIMQPVPGRDNEWPITSRSK